MKGSDCIDANGRKSKCFLDPCGFFDNYPDSSKNVIPSDACAKPNVDTDRFETEVAKRVQSKPIQRKLMKSGGPFVEQFIRKLSSGLTQEHCEILRLLAFDPNIKSP